MEEFIKEITIQAGRAVLGQFGKIGAKYSKEHATDVVTEADLISNKILTDAIKKKYPNHGIISEEEEDHQIDAEYIWILDPLDGTLNFSTRVPTFGVITALARNKKVEMGAIYLPYFKEFYFAQVGEGAYLNGQRIRCSGKRTWEESYGAAGANMRPGRNQFWLNLIKDVEKQPVWVNSFGCVAVGCAYVACGRRDWYTSPGGKIWDYAGGSVILSEAGCVVTDIEGKPWSFEGKGLVAANKYLYPKLLELASNKK